MDREKLKDVMARVHQRMNAVKSANGGEWPKGPILTLALALTLTSEEAEAVMSALETAGEL